MCIHHYKGDYLRTLNVTAWTWIRLQPWQEDLWHQWSQPWAYPFGLLEIKVVIGGETDLQKCHIFNCWPRIQSVYFKAKSWVLFPGSMSAWSYKLGAVWLFFVTWMILLFCVSEFTLIRTFPVSQRQGGYVFFLIIACKSCTYNCMCLFQLARSWYHSRETKWP